MSEETDEIIENVKEAPVEPLEVKIIEKEKKEVNEDMDYEEFDISSQEIEDFENGN